MCALGGTIKQDLIRFILPLISTRLFIAEIEDCEGALYPKFKYPN
jgi:hypothetical protein